MTISQNNKTEKTLSRLRWGMIGNEAPFHQTPNDIYSSLKQQHITIRHSEINTIHTNVNLILFCLFQDTENRIIPKPD